MCCFVFVFTLVARSITHLEETFNFEKVKLVLLFVRSRFVIVYFVLLRESH